MSSGSARPRREWVVRAGVFLALLSVCGPVVALLVERDHALSVIDEFAYADYLHKVHDGQPYVRRGELTGQDTLRELACRGYSPPIWTERPPCDAPELVAGYFPNSGINSADIHPPTYFVVTDLGARVAMAARLTDNLVTAGRLAGAAWMAAGLTALWCLLRAVGARRVAAASCLALVGASGGLLAHWHHLTPDAANVLVGSLVALAALRWERTRSGLALLAATGALALGVKAPNLVVVVAVAGYLVARGRLGGDLPRARRSHLAAAGSLLGGAAAVSVAWVAVRSALAVPGVTSPMDEAERVGGLRLDHLTDNLARFVTVWDQPGAGAYPLALVTSYLLVGSLVAALVALSRRHPRHTLALVAGVAVVAGPLLLVLLNYMLRGTYAPIEARYGATLVPLQCAVAAPFWRHRAALAGVAALAVAYGLVVVVPLVS